MLHQNAKWIWIREQAQKNEYAIFEEHFSWTGGNVVVKIAAETDYILYVNGRQAAFGQFAGWPFLKYCDQINITEFCREGENTLSITVRYEGVNSFTHIEDGAGVIFTVEENGALRAFSSENTLGGYDNRYIQHREREITMQLGLSSAMGCGNAVADSKCTVVSKTYNIVPRPVKKTETYPLVQGKKIFADKEIYDLGREEVGYLCIKVRAAAPAAFRVAYGEHIADGCVRQRIPYGKHAVDDSGEVYARDFSLDFETDGGEREFTQYFVRLACRYLEVFAPEGVKVLSIGLIPALYPLTEKPCYLEGLDRQIYETCVRTLRLSMNMHYEDCPWREQALYVLDSRNQMLCGYYAFRETEFPRAILSFITNGKRPDGLLELTYPAINTPAIPFFSVMYPVAVWEYIQHTGDKTILQDTMDTMYGIMDNMRKRLDGTGLIPELEAPYWNFYEWSPGSDGNAERTLVEGRKRAYHLLLNCAFLYSCKRFKELCQLDGREFFVDMEKTKEAIQKAFLNEETGLYALDAHTKKVYSQLGNAFALLVGLGDERTARAIKEDTTLVPATLSMLGYVYDALLEYDKQNKDFVLEDIRQKYGYMLSQGATSFWETIEGEAAFDDAGSLCHGWSAMPVYYYNILGENI